jgi:dolichol-phosphate mannosyltransferase
MKPTLIILPTYNEKESLPVTVKGINNNAKVDILIVDDNSPDGTGELADQLAKINPNIHVLHRATKNGLGGAYLEGFGWALDNGYELIGTMDADGSHQPKYLPELLKASETADIVCGSRWVQGGGTLNWPLHRQILSRSGSLYSRSMLKLPLSDVTGGYRIYTANTLRLVLEKSVESEGYCFQIDLALRAHNMGLTIKEVPIVFVERTQGVSKMNTRIVLEAIGLVTKWGIKSRFNKLSRY